MKLQIKAILSVENKKTVVRDENGQPFDPMKEIAARFHLNQDESVHVLLLSDNGKEERPFTIDEAKLILGRKHSAVITTVGGGDVKIYTCGASGDYPVVGLDDQNRGCCWTADGEAMNGDETIKLVIRDK